MKSFDAIVKKLLEDGVSASVIERVLYTWGFNSDDAKNLVSSALSSGSEAFLEKIKDNKEAVNLYEKIKKDVSLLEFYILCDIIENKYTGVGQLVKIINELKNKPDLSLNDIKFSKLQLYVNIPEIKKFLEQYNLLLESNESISHLLLKINDIVDIIKHIREKYNNDINLTPLVEKYEHLIMDFYSDISEYKIVFIIESFINDFKEFLVDDKIKNIFRKYTSIVESNKVRFELIKIYERYKNLPLYTGVIKILDQILNEKNENELKDFIKYRYSDLILIPEIEALREHLINNIKTTTNKSYTIKNVVAPIVSINELHYFYLNNLLYKINEQNGKVIDCAPITDENEKNILMKNLPEWFLLLFTESQNGTVQFGINENGISVSIYDNYGNFIDIYETKDGIYLKTETKNILLNEENITNLYTTIYSLAPNTNLVKTRYLNLIQTIYEYFHSIYELDFAQIVESLDATKKFVQFHVFVFENEQVYVNKINTYLNEMQFIKINKPSDINIIKEWITDYTLSAFENIVEQTQLQNKELNNILNIINQRLDKLYVQKNILTEKMEMYIQKNSRSERDILNKRMELFNEALTMINEMITEYEQKKNKIKDKLCHNQ